MTPRRNFIQSLATLPVFTHFLGSTTKAEAKAIANDLSLTFVASDALKFSIDFDKLLTISQYHHTTMDCPGQQARITIDFDQIETPITSEQEDTILQQATQHKFIRTKGRVFPAHSKAVALEWLNYKLIYTPIQVPIWINANILTKEGFEVTTTPKARAILITSSTRPQSIYIGDPVEIDKVLTRLNFRGINDSRVKLS